MSMVEDVARFMAAAEQQNTPEQVERQIGFVAEEAEELFEAADAGDRLEMLDAFLDTAWVAIGGAIAMGADVEGAWAEVVRSNMSKVNAETGKMDRDANGKVVKPAHFSPPDLARFLPEAKQQEGV